MITITRRLARDAKTVFRRALGFTRYHDAPPLEIVANDKGLTMRALRDGIAAEYHDPEPQDCGTVVVPFQFLLDCEGARPEEVTIEPPRDGHIFSRWQNGNVPQLFRYEHDQAIDTQFPLAPTELASNPPDLLVALRDAVDTTDPEPTRYALSNFQLRGSSGTIVATDGRQLLYHEGFRFPWEDDVLARRTTVFGSKELPHDVPVTIGKTDDWVTVRIGPWTFHLQIDKDGRFPRTDENLPNTDVTVTRLRIADADRHFLLQTLRRLPCDDELNGPVTVDLNGAVAIRATGADQAQPTEIVLRSSERVGDPTRVNMNRLYLARAIRMGFGEVLITDPQAPLLCCDDRRKYLWAPLDHKSAIKPHENAVRIESPVDTPSQIPPRKRRSTKGTMPQSTKQDSPGAGSNGRSATKARTAKQESPASALEQATALRTALRDAVNETSELIRALKREQKQSKLVRSTLASLRQIQTVDV